VIFSRQRLTMTGRCASHGQDRGQARRLRLWCGELCFY
jgi:hypothetical protein